MALLDFFELMDMDEVLAEIKALPHGQVISPAAATGIIAYLKDQKIDTGVHWLVEITDPRHSIYQEQSDYDKLLMDHLHEYLLVERRA